MERLTKKTIGCFEYNLKDHKPIIGEFGTYEAFFDYSMAVRLLGKYEDTGLTPEEISRLLTLIEQQGTELNRRDELIRKIDAERDYWELEAKRYCGVLGEQKIKLQKLKCEMCRLEDTGKCREC